MFQTSAAFALTSDNIRTEIHLRSPAPFTYLVYLQRASWWIVAVAMTDLGDDGSTAMTPFSIQDPLSISIQPLGSSEQRIVARLERKSSRLSRAEGMPECCWRCNLPATVAPS